MAFVRSFVRSLPRKKSSEIISGVQRAAALSPLVRPAAPAALPQVEPATILDNKEEGDSSWSWGWTPPARAKLADGDNSSASGLESGAYEIPVEVGKLLESHEVVQLLESHGAVNVETVPITDARLESIEEMIFATGRAPTHLRRLASRIVGSLKTRQLSKSVAPGVTGAEGRDCDDWMLVDCGNLVVHLMDSHTRR